MGELLPEPGIDGASTIHGVIVARFAYHFAAGGRAPPSSAPDCRSPGHALATNTPTREQPWGWPVPDATDRRTRSRDMTARCARLSIRPGERMSTAHKIVDWRHRAGRALAEAFSGLPAGRYVIVPENEFVERDADPLSARMRPRSRSRFGTLPRGGRSRGKMSARVCGRNSSSPDAASGSDCSPRRERATRRRASIRAARGAQPACMYGAR